MYEAQGTAGKKEVDIYTEEEGPTVSAVLQKLAKLFGQRIYDYLVVVNGREIMNSEIKLSKDDTIVIFMPVSGG